ncbi:MAG TPA: hypothetical protein VMT37_07150 [Solirubrobacterales bacterium]|nr:hypothetical protein [Solirubrobacterales bacterium]
MAAVAGASYLKPPLGAWSLGSGSGFTRSASGFTLKNGKGSKKREIVLSNFHLKLNAASECEVAPKAMVKIPAPIALKQFHRGGYSAWGIGKNVGGEPYYAPTRVLVEGKSTKGYFYMLWNYSDPSVVTRGGVAFGSCTLEFNGGAPK